MPWRPLPRIAFAVAIYPFQPSSPADLPLELGDELYIIEEGGRDYSWYRGYLVAPPSLLAGLTSVKGQTLEARVFSGIFPRNCVEVREVLGEGGVNGSAEAEEKINGHNGEIVDGRDTSGNFKDGSLRRSMSATKDKDHTPSAVQKVNGIRNSLSTETKVAQRASTPSKSQVKLLPITPATNGSQEPKSSRPPAPVPMLKIGDETPTSSSEPLVDEIASCLREWHSTNLHELLLSRRYKVLDKLSKLVHQLDLSRRQLLHGVLTNQELDVLREKTVWELVSGNKMLSNEIIVRDPAQRGRLLTGDDTAIEISKLQSTMSLLDRPPTATTDNVNLHHLMVEFKGLASHGRESPTLIVSLFSKRSGEPAKQLTEGFAVDVPQQEHLSKAVSTGKLRTLFSNLTPNDIGEAPGSDVQLYLVVKVQSHQPIQSAPPIPSRAGTVRDSRSTKESTGSAGSFGAGTAKSGRRSLMWGQSRLDRSQRHRPQNSSMGQSMGSAGSTPSIAEEDEHDNASVSRPSTSVSSSTSVQPGIQYVKRSAGVAVLPLKQFLTQVRDGEQTLSVWSPNEASMDIQDPEHGWDDIIEEIMTCKSKCFEKSKLVNRIRLRLHSFINFDADTLIRRTPTLLHNIPQTPKMGFSGAPTKPRSDIYITISSPHLPAHALFSHPERGNVQLSSSLDMHNIQLVLEVRKSSGERIKDCIFPSSNSPGLTAWRTTAIDRGDAWNQTIKLVVPREDVPNTHLIMSVANNPDFPFALAWMPLWDQHAFLRDGRHSPLLYLYDKVTSNTERGRGAYLDFPWDSLSKDDQPKIESLTGPVAVLRLDSYLCSTEFSQDHVLLGVLGWRDQPEDQLLVMLRQLVFVPEIEIVKLFSDVFDALFSILVDRSGNDEYEDLIFNDLVTVLGIVHDRRFNLGPLVTEYAETRFNYPFATPCLIRSYLRLLATPADYQNSRNLRATFKVGREILKFIVTARKQQKVKEAGIGITTTQPIFNRDFKRIFAALESLMREPSPTLIGSKTLVVQHMHTWLPELTDCFTQEEIVQIAVSFVNSCADVKGKLVLHKLVLILNLTRSVQALETDQTFKLKFANTIKSWISPYWGSPEEVTDQYKEQTRLCCSIVATQLLKIGPEFPNYLIKIVQSYQALRHAKHPSKDTLTLLFPTVYPFQAKPVSTRTSFEENLIELAALLAGFSPEVLARNIESLGAETADVLSAALEMSMSVLRCEAFPSTWLTLHVYHHRSVLKLLDAISVVMRAKYLPSPDDADEFNTELWKTFFTTLLKLVRSEALALETFPEQKRRAVWKIAGDVREQGAALLEKCWDAVGWETTAEEQQQYGPERLGGYQVQYVPSLVAPILELCMSVHEGLRGVAVKILQTMIVSEWMLNEDLTVVQAEMVECLDQLFKFRDIGESAQQKLFVTELLDLFESLAQSPGDQLWEAIKQMVSTVDELLDLLIAVHNTDATKAVRIMHTLKLMDFLKGMQKEDIYIRYVHQLAEVQAQSRNTTEAGLALRLHANLYTWDTSRMVDALVIPPFPKQTAFERKETLYFEMIKYFEEGAAWDAALSSYRELAEQYEFVLFDFAKLARTHRSTAKVFEIIARGEGLSPRYFRVVHRGLGFHVGLRDKQFIYEGQGSERLSSFTDRLQQQYPAAQLVSHGEVDAEIEGQFLLVSAVNPHRDLDHQLYHRAKVPQSTRDFILSSRPNNFSITTKRHSPKHNVKDQWIEKTVYTTADTFPTILRKSEIVSVDVVPLSPLQTAVERTTRKTSELAVLEKRIVEGDDSSFFNLTEAIKSSVTPNSATTVAQYRELLPQPEDSDPDADDETSAEAPFQPLEDALKIALLDFASTLRRCLTLYTRPAQLATQADFTTQFNATFAPELAVLAPPISPITLQQSPSWLPKPPIALESSLPEQPHDPNETLVNGDTHAAEPPVLNGTTQFSTNDMNSSTRSRFSSFMKRAKTYDSQPSTNGISSTNHLPHSDSRSVSSSRATSQSRGEGRRNGRVSTEDSRDGHALNSPMGKGRGRSDSDARPMTAKSAATVTSSVGARGGSLRKRLSSLAIGKKSSKATFAGNGNGVLEEE